VTIADDDLPAILDELGVPVTVGSTTVKAILRKFTLEELAEEGAGTLLDRGVVATIQSGALGTVPGPNPGTPITIVGGDHLVLKSLRIGHGVLTEIWCRPKDGDAVIP